MYVFDDDLRRELQDPEYRKAYAEDYLNTFIATQIQVIREQRGLSQKELADLIGTKQPGISRLENIDHSSWKSETLKRIADALGVRLRVSFETYGDLITEAKLFSRNSLQRPKFEDDASIHRTKVLGFFTAVAGAGTKHAEIVGNKTAVDSSLMPNKGTDSNIQAA